jgi:hypothetical protein
MYTIKKGCEKFMCSIFFVFGYSCSSSYGTCLLYLPEKMLYNATLYSKYSTYMYMQEEVYQKLRASLVFLMLFFSLVF